MRAAVWREKSLQVRGEAKGFADREGVRLWSVFEESGWQIRAVGEVMAVSSRSTGIKAGEALARSRGLELFS